MNSFYSSIKIFKIIHKNVKKSTIITVLNSILGQTLYIFLVIFKNLYLSLLHHTWILISNEDNFNLYHNILFILCVFYIIYSTLWYYLWISWDTNLIYIILQISWINIITLIMIPTFEIFLEISMKRLLFYVF